MKRVRLQRFVCVYLRFRPQNLLSAAGLSSSTPKSRLVVTFFNARSIVNKLNLLDNICNHHTQSFDIIFITETWLHAAIPDSLVCPKRHQIMRDDRIHSRGGGVLALFKSDLNESKIDVLRNNSTNYL